jgi:hypothetical protein
MAALVADHSRVNRHFVFRLFPYNLRDQGQRGMRSAPPPFRRRNFMIDPLPEDLEEFEVLRRIAAVLSAHAILLAPDPNRNLEDHLSMAAQHADSVAFSALDILKRSRLISDLRSRKATGS